MTRKRSRKNYPEYWVEHVALWQFLCFFLLLCLVWVTEMYDIPAMVFGRHPSDLNLDHACMLSAIIIAAGIITVWNTYLQQRYIIKGFFIVCSYCRKMTIDRDTWEHIDQFFGAKSLAVFSHGICPTCFEKISKEEDYMSKSPPATPGTKEQGMGNS